MVGIKASQQIPVEILSFYLYVDVCVFFKELSNRRQMRLVNVLVQQLGRAQVRQFGIGIEGGTEYHHDELKEKVIHLAREPILEVLVLKREV